MKNSKSDEFEGLSMNFFEMREIRGGFDGKPGAQGAYSSDSAGMRTVATSAFGGETAGSGNTTENNGG